MRSQRLVSGSMFKQEFMVRVGRFIVVGLVVMGTFMLLNRVLAPRLGADRAFLVAYVPAVALHFCLNKWWTFGGAPGSRRRQVGEYIIMVGLTFAIQWCVFKLLTALTPFPSWIDAGCANAAQVAITFFVLQRRIFAPRSSAPGLL